MSKTLVDHLALLFKVGVERYVSQDMIREVECPDDRARLYRMIRRMEEERGGE